MRFTKMQGCGNDYVYVNGFEEKIENKDKVAIKVSDRHFGIGSDGLIFINPSKIADCEMEMYNSDGTRAEMCGNGVRCVAKFAYDQGIAKKNVVTVETLAGIKTIQLLFDESGKNVIGGRVDMGAPILIPEEVPCVPESFYKEAHGMKPILEAPLMVKNKEYKVSCVSMGNPHAIVYWSEDISRLDISKIGPSFENHPAFPRRTNTEFVNVIDEKTVAMRVWERGAGETFACGTGACGVAVASILNGFTKNEVTVKLLGGDLKISWDGKAESSVFMEGPATTVFEGEIEV